MMDINSRQAVLEANVLNLTKNVDELAKLIKGNGKPSLDVRLDRIENKLSQLVKADDKTKDSFQRIKERVFSWGAIVVVTFIATATWTYVLGLIS